jgi:hypothetical protein
MEAATLGKVASNFQPLLLFFVLVFCFFAAELLRNSPR